MSTAPQPDFLPISAAINAGKLFTILSFSILVWDSLATLPTERKVVWQAKWTATKVAYLINRYWTIISSSIAMGMLFSESLPADACLRVARIVPIGTIVTLLACSCIFAIRVYVMFEQDHRILFMLGSFVVVESVIMSVAVSHFLPYSVPPPIYGCITLPKPTAGTEQWPLLFWGTPLVLDTIILVLTIKRVIHHQRAGATTPILATFVREARFYYVVIVLVTFSNVVVDAMPDPQFQSINSVGPVIFTSLMASRSVLHRLNLSRTPPTSSHTRLSSTFLPIHFAAGPRRVVSLIPAPARRPLAKRLESISISELLDGKGMASPGWDTVEVLRSPASRGEA